ncbi:MAG: TIR domain-containing protein [Nostocaceae cyanobacterium]|nr:TIR domain-containing protein [Nostocaceae cyanobacterium]
MSDLSDFYLVYDVRDEDTATLLERGLARWNLNVISIKNTLAGDNLVNKIREAITRNKYILVLVSNNYIDSHLLREIIANGIIKSKKRRKRK